MFSSTSFTPKSQEHVDNIFSLLIGNRKKSVILDGGGYWVTESTVGWLQNGHGSVWKVVITPEDIHQIIFNSGLHVSRLNCLITSLVLDETSFCSRCALVHT